VRARVPVVRCTECDTAWVLRVSMSLTGGPDEYLFQRDCKHQSPNTLGTVSFEELELAVLTSVTVPDHPFEGEANDTVGGGTCTECGWQRNDSIHADPAEDGQ
jgi:hypothetical protein